MTPCRACMTAGSKALLQAIFTARCAGDLGENVPSTYVTVRGLVAHAAAIAGATVAEVEGRRRQRSVVDLRRAAAWVACQATPMSLPEIGRRLGGRDHSTVINLRCTGEERVKRDPVFAAFCEQVWTAAELAPFGPGSVPPPPPPPEVHPLRAESLQAVPRHLHPRPRDADDDGEGGERHRAERMQACSRTLIAALHREHPDKVPVLPRAAEPGAVAVRAGYCREAIA